MPSPPRRGGYITPARRPGPPPPSVGHPAEWRRRAEESRARSLARRRPAGAYRPEVLFAIAVGFGGVLLIAVALLMAGAR